MSNMEKNQHAGHRKRLKRRYIDSNGNGFSDHELLELLLFYGIPRKNTNEIAHSLIEHFGSVNSVAEASLDELKLVDGIGDDCAILLDLVMLFAKKYSETHYKESKRLNTIGDLAAYAQNHTFGAVKELVYGVFLDDNLNVLGTNLIASGTINEVRLMLRTIIELCVIKRATALAIFHNHPNGGVEPSPEDVDFTITLERELEIIGVELVEHIIVDGKDYLPLLKSIHEDRKFEFQESDYHEIEKYNKTTK